jgi:hypothetical protein
MRKHISPAGEKIGLNDVGWHSFRHSYRGMLDDTGANTGTQQGLMRHANVSTTMNIYGRASMKAKQEANSKVVQMILPRKLIVLSVGMCGDDDSDFCAKLLKIWCARRDSNSRPFGSKPNALSS